MSKKTHTLVATNKLILISSFITAVAVLLVQVLTGMASTNDWRSLASALIAAPISVVISDWVATHVFKSPLLARLLYATEGPDLTGVWIGHATRQKESEQIDQGTPIVLIVMNVIRQPQQIHYAVDLFCVLCHFSDTSATLVKTPNQKWQLRIVYTTVAIHDFARDRMGESQNSSRQLIYGETSEQERLDGDFFTRQNRQDVGYGKEAWVKLENSNLSNQGCESIVNELQRRAMEESKVRKTGREPYDVVMRTFNLDPKRILKVESNGSVVSHVSSSSDPAP